LVKKMQFTYGKGGIPPTPNDRPKLHDLRTVDAGGKPITLSEGRSSPTRASYSRRSTTTRSRSDSRARGQLQQPGAGLERHPHCAGADLDIVNADECSSVTAEIIRTRVLTYGQVRLERQHHEIRKEPLPVTGLRIRVTGQLFFDGSHIPRPCSGRRGAPRGRCTRLRN